MRVTCSRRDREYYNQNVLNIWVKKGFLTLPYIINTFKCEGTNIFPRFSFLRPQSSCSIRHAKGSLRLFNCYCTRQEIRSGAFRCPWVQHNANAVWGHLDSVAIFSEILSEYGVFKTSSLWNCQSFLMGGVSGPHWIYHVCKSGSANSTSREAQSDTNFDCPASKYLNVFIWRLGLWFTTSGDLRQNFS